MDITDEHNCVKIYESMIFGEIPSAASKTKREKKIGGWVDGHYEPIFETSACSETREDAACPDEDIISIVKSAVLSSAEAQSKWTEVRHFQRCLTFDKIAKELKKQRSAIPDLVVNQSLKNNLDLAVDYFNYYSGIEIPSESRFKRNGVVFMKSCRNPAWCVAAMVAVSLWRGQSIIIKPSREHLIFTMLLAQICSEAGLPKGLINVIPGCIHVADEILKSEEVIKVFDAELVHTAFIVFESSDLDGAVDKLFSETWKFGRKSAWTADLVVVQESIYKVFTEKLTSKMKKIDRRDKVFRFKGENVQFDLEKILSEAERMGAEVFAVVDGSDSDQILIAEHKIEPFTPDAPITTLLAFRTAKEAINIVNNDSFCIGTSIWTGNLAQGMEVVSQLETSTIWINCHGVYDASVPVELWGFSGTILLGGIHGGSSSLTIGEENTHGFCLRSEYSEKVKDIAAASHKSFMKWKSNKSKKEFLMKILDSIRETSKVPVEKLSRLIEFWAISGNTYEITMRSMNDNLFVAQSKKPVGVIEMVLDEDPDDEEKNLVIFKFVSWVIPAIMMGNAVIVVIHNNDTPLKDVIQCFVSNLPNGVVNVVEGLHYAYQIAKSPYIQAVWMENGIDFDMKKISTGEKLRRFLYPSGFIQADPKLLAMHCLKNQAVWCPTINSSS